MNITSFTPLDTDFFIPTQHATKQPQDVLDDIDIQLDDPDTAYWANHTAFDPNDPICKEQLIKDIIEANKIQLNLKKKYKRTAFKTKVQQHSIQFSLFDALVLCHTLISKTPTSWQLTMPNQTQTPQWQLSCNTHQLTINYNHPNITITQNKRPMGTLCVDMEHHVIEKVHGTLFNAPFIIDPIWKHEHTTTDAVKLHLGPYTTEIVHHPKHKQTLWQHPTNTNMMRIVQNKTTQINKNLYINKKEFSWEHPTFSRFFATQCYCPWQPFAIQGSFLIQ